MLRELKTGSGTRRGQKRQHRKKAVTRVIVILVVILLILLIAILIYVWLTSNNSNVQVVNQTPKASPVIRSPGPIAQNQKVGVYITSLTTPIASGNTASVTIRTLPQAACSIDVVYNGLKSVDTGLVPKDADEYGVVRWNWHVEKGQPKGKWPVNITCAKNGSSGYMRGDLVIEG
ncbi:MAG: hypothetical protein WAQ25_03770 [Candidatus Saccharimonas sp.]